MSASNNVNFGLHSSSSNQNNTSFNNSPYLRRAAKKDPTITLTESIELPPSATPAQKGLLKIMHRIEKRKAASIELLLHLIFTGVFITIVVLQRSVYDGYLMNLGLSTALQTQSQFANIGTWVCVI